MPDERWHDIFGEQLRPLRGYAPGPLAPPVSVPHPTCPEHCSGKHAPDGVMVCRSCGGEKYRVIAHEYAWREGHYFNSVEPLNGAGPYDVRETTCCRATLVRLG